MNPKKCLTLLCAAVFLVILLTGCSRAEMGYYNLQKEINNLKLYESTGEITFNLEQLPGELTKGEDATTIALIQSIFKNTSLSYTAKVDEAGRRRNGAGFFVATARVYTPIYGRRETIQKP